jgi:hypothetical protein
MVYRGHVKGGLVVLDNPSDLPEGAEVRVQLVSPREAARERSGSRTLYDRLEGVVGSAKGLPPDASENVDHYLYGHPKV